MNFMPSNFVSNLHYLVTGMISIFIVIGAIALVTVILSKIFKNRDNNK